MLAPLGEPDALREGKEVRETPPIPLIVLPRRLEMVRHLLVEVLGPHAPRFSQYFVPAGGCHRENPNSFLIGCKFFGLGGELDEMVVDPQVQGGPGGGHPLQVIPYGFGGQQVLREVVKRAFPLGFPCPAAGKEDADDHKERDAGGGQCAGAEKNGPLLLVGEFSPGVANDLFPQRGLELPDPLLLGVGRRRRGKEQPRDEQCSNG